MGSFNIPTMLSRCSSSRIGDSCQAAIRTGCFQLYSPNHFVVIRRTACMSPCTLHCSICIESPPWLTCKNLATSPAEQLHDLEDVVGYLTTLGWHIVSLVGHSKAGTVVLQYAAIRNIPSVVAISARFFQDQGR